MAQDNAGADYKRTRGGVSILNTRLSFLQVLASLVMGNTPSHQQNQDTSITSISRTTFPTCCYVSNDTDSDGTAVDTHEKRIVCSSRNYSESFIKLGSPRSLMLEPLHPRPSYRPVYTIPTTATDAYAFFIEKYPEYQMTWLLDALRETDYTRLEKTKEVYLDYMGGCLYPEHLVHLHAGFLNSSVLGNTHSASNSSTLSLVHTKEARNAVLSFFRASPDEYTVLFTANASAAMKLVGEAFPFTDASSYVLCVDSHNSLHGIRQYAAERGARVSYIPVTPQGSVNLGESEDILHKNAPILGSTTSSLFALTGQSNITNSKLPLSLLAIASSLGYSTLLDAAALAPTSYISLEDIHPDAMAVSFYKMFGYPTGVGALVVRKSFLRRLQRPWFAGGTVSIVQVPGSIVTRSSELHEQFEDGTINYLSLPAIVDGLRMLSAYMPFLPLRLSALTHYAIASLRDIVHNSSGRSVVKILSRHSSKKLHFVGEQADTGSIISMIFLGPDGEMLPNSFVEYAASIYSISLRTGCMCNPGGATALLDLQEDMDKLYSGITLHELECYVGHELGVVRISLGLASNFWDVWSMVVFVGKLAHGSTRMDLWKRWLETNNKTR